MREWPLACAEVSRHHLQDTVSRMQVDILGVVACNVLRYVVADSTSQPEWRFWRSSFAFLPASLAGNYPLGTLDYTTSPDYYKLILSTCKLLNRQERIWVFFNIAYLPYGQMLRTHRKLFHQAFEAETSAEYQDFMSSREAPRNV
jgi:hypothetical protein